MCEKLRDKSTSARLFIPVNAVSEISLCFLSTCERMKIIPETSDFGAFQLKKRVSPYLNDWTPSDRR